MCRHGRCQWTTILLALLFGWGGGVWHELAWAECTGQRTGIGTDQGLTVHLSPSCTPEERRMRAVASSTIMEAVAKGRMVSLVGVAVQGDLVFDQLPASEPESREGSSPVLSEKGIPSDINKQRQVRNAVTIRDSIIAGSVRHQSTKGLLRFEDRVDFRGTVFKESVDLSRSMFHGAVDLSGAMFEKEAYFVQGQFLEGLECRDTKFGPHTRFHRSIFRGSVDCTGVLFDGIAELLEVTFDREVSFERARFGSGTGFSGSRFKQRTRFDDAIFSRDAFFGFGVFEGETSFVGAQFLANADFSDAEFAKTDDLARVRFDRPPLFTRTKRATQASPSGFGDSPFTQYGLTALCLVVAALLVGYAFKLK